MNNHANRAPHEKVCGYEYTVRRGDSFYIIANRLGIPLRDLLEANSDINPARLMVGDVLCIPMEEDDAPPEGLTPEVPVPPKAPVPPEVPVPPEAPETPVVPETQPTPEGTPPEELPEDILPDMDEDLDAPALDENMAVCPEANRYTVRQGETVADVQLRANVNRYTLQTANPAADLDRLTTGQLLCVPSVSTACPTASTYTLQAEDTLESVALRLNPSLAALLRTNPCLAPSEFVAGKCIYIPQ